MNTKQTTTQIDYRLARERMVANQLVRRGIKDKRVLEAMRSLPRDRFVEEALIGEAYNDHPLPIGFRQTISQPYMVALMTESLCLQGFERVLEIGTGSGYQTALLAKLAESVYTIERIPALLDKARVLLSSLGFTNIAYKAYDGTLGWPDRAPFEAVIVTAAGPSIPAPLLDQLADGGRLVMPVGSRDGQELVKIVRKGDEYIRHRMGGCRFVNLVGLHGWKE
ncbi:MAG TPA: protein-L-isoaspartate(D-aspartate) O-methyltransferase [Desulfobacteraceae bacterium]|nr:protein-L-isoaspartate(D-aspartate) O-methyltransferase [Desulfobacteraceae bacterium]